jgi:hypothetical protein
MMDPEKIMGGLFTELDRALQGMAKAATLEEKMQYSQIVKNLCDSLGVFLNLMSGISEEDMEEE